MLIISGVSVQEQRCSVISVAVSTICDVSVLSVRHGGSVCRHAAPGDRDGIVCRCRHECSPYIGRQETFGASCRQSPAR